MISACGILINDDMILLVKLSEQTDWILPSGVVVDGFSDWDVIKEIMAKNLNIEVHPFHTMRPFERDGITTLPHILEYASGGADTDVYTDLKFVNKDESKKIKIDIIHRSIVKAFFDSYSVMLKR
jgi:hypothetical protein